MTTLNSITQFYDAMRAAGLEPPDNIVPGKLYRFPGIGKPNGNKAGWCRMFEDGIGGCFGDFSSDLFENWQARRDRPFSQTEKAAFMRLVSETQTKVETERKEMHTESAEKAVAILNAAKPANNKHRYLLTKGIDVNGLKQYKDELVAPVFVNGKISSAQFIAEDGSKRFLKGGRIADGFYFIGTRKDAKALCITEGLATGATIHQATGYPVAIAFNAGNLESVAKTMRKHFPDLPLIVCADDDASTDGNPGITKANLAALAVSAKIAVPTFGKQRPDGVTDFNDMAALLGLDAIAKTIIAATPPEHEETPKDNTWPDPLPLTTKIEPQPYPMDALPETIRAAVEEVRAFTKAPTPLVTSSALAALSLAIQAHADVKRAEKLTGPVGLFLLTIADSGERKSTCDNYFMQTIRDYETNQAEKAKPLLKDHNAAIEAWKAKQAGIKEKIRYLAKNGKSTHEQEDALCDLEHEKPESPRTPRLIYSDATPEALKWNLAKAWPSGGVISSEGGLVLGAHGMGKDSVMRNLATLNQLWDGADIATERRTSESFTVRGARLTISLQVQEAALKSFFDKSGGLARGTGFLARFLVACPESTQGHRPFTDPPETWPALEKFNHRITAILDQDAPIDEDGALTPPTLPLAADTKVAWVKFHDAIESELRSDGELYDVRDVASKTADNATRIATLFQLFENDITSAIGLEAFEGASRIAAWHLHEALRFYGEQILPEELADAIHLDIWLLNYCMKEKISIVSRRDIQRNVTPGHLRQKDALDSALFELVEVERIRLVQDGSRKEIHINPALLKGGTQ